MFEEAGVLVPFGQVAGDDAGVGSFEDLAFRLGRGARVHLGGGQVDMPEDVADVGHEAGTTQTGDTGVLAG